MLIVHRISTFLFVLYFEFSKNFIMKFYHFLIFLFEIYEKNHQGWWKQWKREKNTKNSIYLLWYSSIEGGISSHKSQSTFKCRLNLKNSHK